jgi:hypothetical protein
MARLYKTECAILQKKCTSQNAERSWQYILSALLPFWALQQQQLCRLLIGYKMLFYLSHDIKMPEIVCLEQGIILQFFHPCVTSDV